MRELFERHAEALTMVEREAIWRALAAPTRETQPRWPRVVPAAAVAVTVALVATVTVLQTPRAPRVIEAPRSTVTPRVNESPRPGEAPRPTVTPRPEVERPPSLPDAALDRAARMPVAPPTLRERDLNPSPPSVAPVRDFPPAGVELRVEHLEVGARKEVVQSAPGVVGSVSKLQGLNVRGGRSYERKTGLYELRGAPAAPKPSVAQPPVIPITGGTRLPNDEPFDAMYFKHYGANPFVTTSEDPLSTFAVDVDEASYTVMRRYVGLGHLPPADAVRVEEFVNFFEQGYPRFTEDDFRIVMDGAPSPFGPGYQLLRVGIKGREIDARNRKPARLTFVVDVSGSMSREDRIELVKKALRLLVDQLRSGDQVGIVVYGSVAQVVLEPVAIGERGGREQVLAAIDRLQITGATNAEDGIRLGYEMARRQYRAADINRVVLCSDGVANVGRTGPESILQVVRGEADRGIHLSTIGFGMGNYNDVLMEQLADRGDGNYYYVDDVEEARRVFVENLTGTLQTIAKDAKIQVEFDSTRVLRYRLLGFENRDVADRDFRNDRVDAGEIGAGHEVTALYEVKLAPGVTRGTIAVARFRYARPEHEAAGAPRVREIERRMDAAALGKRFEDAAPRFRLDAAVAEYAEILRGSYWAKESRLSSVLSVARNAAASLRDPVADEFVGLVEKAAELRARNPKPSGGEER